MTALGIPEGLESVAVWDSCDEDWGRGPWIAPAGDPDPVITVVPVSELPPAHLLTG